jgi:hypothetical protein
MCSLTGHWTCTQPYIHLVKPACMSWIAPAWDAAITQRLRTSRRSKGDLRALCCVPHWSLDCALSLYSSVLNHLHVMDCARMGRRRSRSLPLAADAQRLCALCVFPHWSLDCALNPMLRICFKTHLRIMDCMPAWDAATSRSSSTSRRSGQKPCVPHWSLDCALQPIFICLKPTCMS